ncbi:organic hydroperoxide resistance protein [Inhella gelatinilytica]|uniref:Organic hydroperoxide resistance protein n=1 Tax=Inhella gelatinilytica TaxID=2795030 RepID=A0A931NE67_9BURK|nr:organic hydroperoxide resistance protein [Inhella gelatinilytica]MBH9552950.1 organic hydroperoxide resistance protein [Inhella gelatinilytica]
MALDKVVYTARATTTGGRNGHSATGDLKLTLAKPVEMGGTGQGTNPEQLFAAGYSACFMGAMGAVAGKLGLSVPADAQIDAEVDFGPKGTGYGVGVRMAIRLPGLSREDAEKLVATAHQVCPYSNATRNNIDVVLTVV